MAQRVSWYEKKLRGRDLFFIGKSKKTIAQQAYGFVFRKEKMSDRLSGGGSVFRFHVTKQQERRDDSQDKDEPIDSILAGLEVIHGFEVENSFRGIVQPESPDTKTCDA